MTTKRPKKRIERRMAKFGDTMPIEQLAKVEHLARMIATGKTFSEVIDHARMMFPGSKPEDWYEVAVKEVKSAAAVDDETIRGFAIYACRELYRQLIDGGDLPNALKALKLLREFQADA